VLSVTNCPYEQVSCTNRELCSMDERLITTSARRARPRRIKLAAGRRRELRVLDQERAQGRAEKLTARFQSAASSVYTSPIPAGWGFLLR
jgi:hypothetical protein